MATLQDVQSWRDMEVVDADGDKVGKITGIYLDRETGEPEWITVRTGLFGLRSSFVPIQGAERTEDGKIRVPFQKEQVKGAPHIEDDGELTPEEERRLYEHYGRSDYDQWSGEDHTGMPDDRAGRFDRTGDTADTAGTGGTGMSAGAGTTSATGGTPDAEAGTEAADEPVVVGVRLRRVVVVAGEPGGEPR